MSIFGLILVLILIGVVLSYVPMDAKVRSLVGLVIVVFVILELCSMFGVLPSLVGHRGHW